MKAETRAPKLTRGATERVEIARVVDAMTAVDAIEATPPNGEAPVTRIELKSVRAKRQP